MLKKTRDYSAIECMFWMIQNNRNKLAIYNVANYPIYLIAFVPIAQLKFPEGWYYSKSAKAITNKFNNIKFTMLVIG